jgi:integrase
MGRERTGSITTRDGKLYARVSYVDQFGKRREVTRRAKDRADARRIIDELHARLDQHGEDAAQNDRATVGDVIEQYRAEKAGAAVIRDGRKISGLKSSYSFGLMLDVLAQHFGKKKLRDLRPADLHAFKKKRLATPTQYGKDRAIASINRELEALRAVCRWAARQGWIAKSPFELGEPVINKSHEASRDRVLSHDEETALLNACTGRRAYLRAIVVMALDTAMRRGEILKLRWDMVNLAQGVISLPGEITKTGKPRQIPVTYRLQAELEALRSTSGPIGPEVLVFGGAVDLKYGWQCACKAAGITGVRLHDLRHSAITRMIAAGVNPALVMKISGHDSMRTFQRYLNPEASTLRGVAEKLHDQNLAEWGRESEYVN